MSNRIAIVAALAFACLGFVGADGAEPAFVVAGYLPDYRLGGWMSEEGAPKDRLGPTTDVLYFGTSAPEDGRFDGSKVSPRDLAAFAKLHEENGVRTLFVVGGWGKSKGFPALAADSATRERFVGDVLAFCETHKFAGVDYDWEHPKGQKELDDYAALIRETHKQFAPRGLLTTVALASWQDLGKDAYEALDRVHLMSYDQRFPHATFDKSRDDVESLIAQGCPREKIVLGVPFYGRNADGDSRTYAEIVRQDAPAADVDQVDGYAFNGPDLIARKVAYVRSERLAGLMIWEIAQDADGPKSLLGAIGKALKADTSSAPAGKDESPRNSDRE